MEGITEHMDADAVDDVIWWYFCFKVNYKGSLSVARVGGLEGIGNLRKEDGESGNEESEWNISSKET